MTGTRKKAANSSHVREWLGHPTCRDNVLLSRIGVLVQLSIQSWRFEFVFSPPRAMPGCASQGQYAKHGWRLEAWRII